MKNHRSDKETSLKEIVWTQMKTLNLAPLPIYLWKTSWKFRRELRMFAMEERWSSRAMNHSWVVFRANHKYKSCNRSLMLLWKFNLRSKR